MTSRHALHVRYLIAFGAWTLAAQALLASTFVQAALVVPFARWQGTLVQRFLLDGPLMVSVDPSCSGLEVIALCMAGTLAYPVAWSRRLAGAFAGVLVMLALNLVRIAALAGVSQTAWFQTFHVDVWPTVLVVAAAGWILIWMRSVDHARRTPSAGLRRFALWSAAMLIVYAVTVAALTEAGTLDRAARGVAGTATGILTALGADASLNQRVLQVGRMQYLVTPDCITTPLIAFYAAALLALPLGWRTRAWAVAAGVPLFATTAVLRLLTVALPFAVAGTTLVLTHAFNQILTGTALLIGAALWWRTDMTRVRAVMTAVVVSCVALAVGSIAGLGYASLWSAILRALHLTVPPGLTPLAVEGDGQGALLVLPIFQVVFFAAAWVLMRPRLSHRRWLTAAAGLIVTQFAFLVLQGWMSGEGIRPFSALAIRGWAVVVPVALVFLIHRTSSSPAAGDARTVLPPSQIVVGGGHAG